MDGAEQISGALKLFVEAFADGIEGRFIGHAAMRLDSNW
jgi:hypothetical protein